MARLARIVIPGKPHHVTQRALEGATAFSGPEDYEYYMDLLAAGCDWAGTKVWAYCFMPDHVHLLLVPSSEDGLRAALGDTHRRYSRYLNDYEGYSGHLWQERFHSFVLAEPNLAAAVRHVELNPVRAKQVRQARAWRWSSAAAHLAGKDDGLVAVAPLLKRFPDWPAFLREGLSGEPLEEIRRHSRTGRPLGPERFIAQLERKLGRNLTPGKPGRPKKSGGKKTGR